MGYIKAEFALAKNPAFAKASADATPYIPSAKGFRARRRRTKFYLNPIDFFLLNLLFCSKNKTLISLKFWGQKMKKLAALSFLLISFNIVALSPTEGYKPEYYLKWATKDLKDSASFKISRKNNNVTYYTEDIINPKCYVFYPLTIESIKLNLNKKNKKLLSLEVKIHEFYQLPKSKAYIPIPIPRKKSVIVKKEDLQNNTALKKATDALVNKIKKMHNKLKQSDFLERLEYIIKNDKKL